MYVCSNENTRTHYAIISALTYATRLWRLYIQSKYMYLCIVYAFAYLIYECTAAVRALGYQLVSCHNEIDNGNSGRGQMLVKQQSALH